MLPEFLSNEWILLYGGLALTMLIVFSETAFPIGVIIPGGEILLFVSGLLAGTKWLQMSILFLIIPLTLVSFIADLIGYTRGYNIGNTLYVRQDRFYFKRKYLLRTEKFSKKYGFIGLIFGRFIPVIRTFNPIIHGAREKNFTSFFIFSGIGCIIYVNSLLILGFILGKMFPELRVNARYIIGAVIFFIFATPLIKHIRFEIRRKKDGDADL